MHQWKLRSENPLAAAISCSFRLVEETTCWRLLLSDKPLADSKLTIAQNSILLWVWTLFGPSAFAKKKKHSGALCFLFNEALFHFHEFYLRRALATHARSFHFW